MVDYEIPHTYTRGCPQVIATAHDGEQRAMALVELTGCPDEIIASVIADPNDPTGYTALLEWDNQGEGPVAIRWDAGVLHPDQPDAGSMIQVYEEGQEGTHTATITSESDPNRNVTVTFEVPLAATLDLTIKPDESDPSGYAALAIWGPGVDPGPDPTELDITITPDEGDATGYTAVATWTGGAE